MEFDTIAAISTPMGEGAIAIVRLSGDKAVEIANRVFKTPGGKSLMEQPSHTIHYGHLHEPKTGEDGIAKANMWLRCAERVHLKVAEFEAKTFDELFENTKRINWSRYIPYGAQFPVSKASSIKSKLFSTTDIQAIVKKAIVDSLKKSYMETGLLKEDKEKYPIYVFLHKDKVTISIDTTGDALHKRGYREKANKAPIREITPPSTQAPKNHAESGELAATTEGALKIPAPITKPTINTIASMSRKTGLGEASAGDKEVLDVGEIFFFI